jgi:glycosyltransferase involved in cell wall biosynthesis
MIEAMACGTPVIARALGSVPEVVRDGQTGFIVGDLDQAGQAVQSAGGLNRIRIRRYVADNFSQDRMVDDYLRVYQEVLKQHRAGHSEWLSLKGRENSNEG